MQHIYMLRMYLSRLSHNQLFFAFIGTFCFCWTDVSGLCHTRTQASWAPVPSLPRHPVVHEQGSIPDDRGKVLQSITMGKEWEKDEKRERGERQRVTEKSNTLSSTDINWYLPQIFLQVSNQTSLDIVNAPMNCSVILISWHIIVIQSFYFSHKGTMNKDDSRGLVLGWKQVDFWSNEWKALQHSIFRILIYAFFLDMEVNF